MVENNHLGDTDGPGALMDPMFLHELVAVGKGTKVEGVKRDPTICCCLTSRSDFQSLST